MNHLQLNVQEIFEEEVKTNEQSFYCSWCGARTVLERCLILLLFFVIIVVVILVVILSMSNVISADNNRNNLTGNDSLIDCPIGYRDVLSQPFCLRRLILSRDKTSWPGTERLLSIRRSVPPFCPGTEKHPFVFIPAL